MEAVKRVTEQQRRANPTLSTKEFDARLRRVGRKRSKEGLEAIDLLEEEDRNAIQN